MIAAIDPLAPPPPYAATPLGALLPGRVRVIDVQLVVAEATGIPRLALLTPCQRGAVGEARQVGMYLARELTGRSFGQIARAFGLGHPTTALHAHRRIAARLTAEDGLRRRVELLRHRLRGTDPGVHPCDCATCRALDRAFPGEGIQLALPLRRGRPRALAPARARGACP